MAKMKNMSIMQIIDIKNDNFYWFSVVSMLFTRSEHKK